MRFQKPKNTQSPQSLIPHSFSLFNSERFPILSHYFTQKDSPILSHYLTQKDFPILSHYFTQKG